MHIQIQLSCPAQWENMAHLITSNKFKGKIIRKYLFHEITNPWWNVYMFSDLTTVLSCVILTNTFDYVDGMPNHFNTFSQLCYTFCCM